MTNPTQQLTDAEAVEIMEARLGMKPYCMDDSPFFEHPFLHSRDALQPVLEKMTPEEWKCLIPLIGEYIPPSGPIWTWRTGIKLALTLPARTLCLAVAVAIKECAK